MDRFPEMDLDPLAEECHRQTQLFFQGETTENGYCYDLLLRAYRDENERALSHVYRIYQPLLVSRARKHSAFPDSCRDAELFALTALSQFYFATRQGQFEQKFSALPFAIAYMYRCLSTTILLDVRGNSRLFPLLDNQHVSPSTPHAAPPSALNDLLAQIYAIFPDEDDQLLIRLRYVYEMKPAEIAERYPEKWKDARAVSVALQRIRRKLMSHPDFKGFTGEDNDSGSGDARGDDQLM